MSAETNILGAIALSSRRTMPTCIAEGVKPTWFTDHQQRKAYIRCVDLFATGHPIDSYTLASDELEESIILRWIEDTPTATNILSYIEALRLEHKVRSTKQKAELAMDIMVGVTEDTIDQAISDIRALWLEREEKATKQTIYETGVELLREWADPNEGDHLSWPIAKMDREIGPITDELIYIAGRESVGKTALALQMCVCLAHAGVKTSIASMESSQRRITPRLMAMMLNEDILPYKYKKRSESDYKDMEARWAVAKDLLISVEERGMTMTELYAWAQGEKAKGSQLIIVDNMKHIRTDRKYSSTVEQFRDMSARIKFMRDDLGLPVVMLHHLNKQMDVSWSDDIRRDTDILLLMTENEDRTVPADSKSGFPGEFWVDIDVAKNRDGRSSMTILLEYMKQVQTFRGEHEVSQDGLM